MIFTIKDDIACRLANLLRDPDFHKSYLSEYFSLQFNYDAEMKTYDFLLVCGYNKQKEYYNFVNSNIIIKNAVISNKIGCGYYMTIDGSYSRKPLTMAFKDCIYLESD